MAASTLIVDYVGRGTFAARPVTPNIPAGATAIYMATDTGNSYIWNGTVWALIAGSVVGTVTSVAATVPGEFAIAGSPITTNGTLSITWATQTANKVLASATSGGAATPAFRALVAADLPATAVTPGAYTAANITVDAAGRLTAAANGGGGSGTVTNVATGTGLSGGPITTTGTISLANTAVTPASYTNTSLTVDQQGRITAAASGSSAGANTNTFIYPAISSTSIFTKDGSNVYPSSAAIKASIAAGDTYRISVTVSGWVTASKAVGFYILNGNVTNTKGYIFEFGTDGKCYLATYNNTTYPTTLKASAASLVNQAPDFTYLEGTIVFGTTVNQLCFTSEGTLSMAGGDNIVAFPGGNFYLAIQAPTFADIKKVTVELMSP